MIRQLLKDEGVELIEFPAKDLETWQSFSGVDGLKQKWIADQMEIGVPESTVYAVVERWLDLEPEMLKRYPEEL